LLTTKSTNLMDKKLATETDLTNEPDYAEGRVWVCDIEEADGEDDNDFLFYGDITSDGTAEMKPMKDSGKCIFQGVMYDIQEFIPDEDCDGKLAFKIKFGANTEERSEDCPQGWEVEFKDLVGTSKKYEGIINTSWWGDRKVVLKSFKSLTSEEREKYPDFVATHYKTKQ